ncbi:MAG: hypothetical protein WC942_01105 [Clostridia bacterium]|jgi:hypothetical protein
MARHSKSKTKYLVKEEDGIYTIFDDFFDDIQARDEALVIAMRTLSELHIVLKKEAISGKSLFIGNMKITTGFQRCLDELNRRWPFLHVEMYSTQRKVDGISIPQIC